MLKTKECERHSELIATHLETTGIGIEHVRSVALMAVEKTPRDLGQRKRAVMKDSVTHCPKCMVKTKVIETIPHFKYGYPSKRRQRQCPQCGMRRMTVEIPIERGDKYFSCSQSK